MKEAFTKQYLKFELAKKNKKQDGSWTNTLTNLS